MMSDWLFLAGWLVCGIITARVCWLTIGERDIPGIPMLALVVFWPLVVAAGMFILVVALVYFLVTWKNPFADDDDDCAGSA